MNEHSTYGNFNSDDIRRYLEGKMSLREMHLIEKAALDDPFLSDAIDGFRLTTSPQQEKDLWELKERLAKKTAEKRSNRFTWWRMAAILLLVLGASLAAWYLSKPAMEQPAIVKNEELRPLPKNDTPAILQQLITDTTDIGDKSPAKELVNSDLSKTKNSRATEITKDQEAIIAADEKSAINQSKADNEKEKSSAEKPISANAIPPSREEGVSAAQSKAPVAREKNDDARFVAPATINKSVSPAETLGKNTPTFYFKGRVADSLDKPVPYANVRISNSANGTYTDVQGRFSFVSSDSVLTTEIVSVGFNKKSLTLTARPDPVIIHLETSSTALNDVVVTAQGRPKAKRQAESADSSNDRETLSFAEPAAGWSLYEIYIKNNLRIPTTPGIPTLRGAVIVSFHVDPRGRLSDFRIEKSLGTLYDKEAIRVLKDGPPWGVYNAESGLRTTYTILY